MAPVDPVSPLSPVLAKVMATSSTSKKLLTDPFIKLQLTAKYPDNSLIESMVNNAKRDRSSLLDILKCPLIWLVLSSMVLKYG